MRISGLISSAHSKFSSWGGGPPAPAASTPEGRACRRETKEGRMRALSGFVNFPFELWREKKAQSALGFGALQPQRDNKTSWSRPISPDGPAGEWRKWKIMCSERCRGAHP